jgi:PKD domain-containing protein/Big-like domain-containing protein
MHPAFRGASSLAPVPVGLLTVGALLLSACGGGSDLVLPGGGTEAAALAIRTQPPAAVASGQGFDRQPVVQIRDEQGNDVAITGVEITASLASGGGELTGTTRRTSDNRGSATFTDLAITGAPGLRTLVFTAPDYGSVTSIDIQVIAAPPAAVGTTTTIDSDDPDPSIFGKAIIVHFTVTSPSGNPTGDVVVSDSKGGSCIGRAPSGSCTLNPAGSGGRTITATYQGDSNFSGSSDTEVHTVRQPNPNNQRPNADFELQCNDLTKTCTFSDTSEDRDGSLVSWWWKFGDGTESHDRNPSPHTYPAQSEYLVDLTVRDNDGATDTRTKRVKMDD